MQTMEGVMLGSAMEARFEKIWIRIRHATHRSQFLPRINEDWLQTPKHQFWRSSFIDLFCLQYETIEPLDELEDWYLWRPLRVQICGQFTRSFRDTTARVSFGLGGRQFRRGYWHLGTCDQPHWSLVARAVLSEHSQAEQVDAVEEVEGLFKLVLQLLQCVAWVIRAIDELGKSKYRLVRVVEWHFECLHSRRWIDHGVQLGLSSCTSKASKVTSVD